MFGKLAKHPNGQSSGVVSNALVTAEYAAASYAFGYLQNSGMVRTHIFGVPVDLAAGVAAKAASLGLTLAGVAGGMRPHLDVLGNTGIGAYFHTLGSGHGFSKSGRVRAILPAGSAGKLQSAIPGVTILGVASSAPKGDLLTSADLAALAR